MSNVLSSVPEQYSVGGPVPDAARGYRQSRADVPQAVLVSSRGTPERLTAPANHPPVPRGPGRI